MHNSRHSPKNYHFFVFASLILALTGCASTTPQLDSKFGDAVNAAKAQQIINPEASQNTNPVLGLGGNAASAVIELYHASFKTPPTTNVSVGSGSGSSSGSSSGSTIK